VGGVNQPVMNKKTEIIGEVKKAMEFYRELGFTYLPVHRADILELQVKQKPTGYESPGEANVDVSEQKVHYGSGQDDSLKVLRDEIGDCRRCKLSEKRNNIVFGEGRADARLMYIGEGPGRDEDLQARPFVGDAGKLLTKLIVKLGFKREDVYIANIVKCRPPLNRNPEADEISVCKLFLEKQIEIIKPAVIVCLGAVAAHSLLGIKVPISRLRGNFYQYNEIPVMPTFHPAYLLRNPGDKWLTWDDMHKVLKVLSVG
jgi:DNA polymerase